MSAWIYLAITAPVGLLLGVVLAALAAAGRADRDMAAAVDDLTEVLD